MPRQNHTLPHQPYQPAKRCDQKRRYPTERQAKETADHQMLVNPSLELATYKCPECHGWHLTRQHHNER